MCSRLEVQEHTVIKYLCLLFSTHSAFNLCKCLNENTILILSSIDTSLGEGHFCYLKEKQMERFCKWLHDTISDLIHVLHIIIFWLVLELFQIESPASTDFDLADFLF